MITSLFDSKSRPVSLRNLDMHCALDHDLVSMNCSIETDYHDMRDDKMFDEIPDNRCYKSASTRSDPWIPGSPEFALQLMHPVAWIQVKQTNTVYELLGMGGYICGHSHFNNSKLDLRESIYQFKKLHPELNFIFELDEIKNITNDLLVLGAHLNVDRTEQIHAEIMCELETNLTYCFKDVMWNGWFSRLSHLTNVIMLNIPQHQNNHIKLLPHATSDKLNNHGDALVEQLVKKLDIATVENFEVRARVINKTVSQWMADTNFNKLIDRLLANDAELYQKILSYYITQEIVSQLDTLIKKAIQNEVN